jgi:hypothetical protein
MTGATCAAKLRDGSRCRSAATHAGFCAYHAAIADHLGEDVVVNGGQSKRRNARCRALVVAESEPLELNASRFDAAGVRPARVIDLQAETPPRAVARGLTLATTVEGDDPDPSGGKQLVRMAIDRAIPGPLARAMEGNDSSTPSRRITRRKRKLAPPNPQLLDHAQDPMPRGSGSLQGRQVD